MGARPALDSNMSKVVIGWIDPGVVSGPFAASLAQTIGYGTIQGHIGGVLRRQSGPIIDKARNELVAQFLETGAGWLMTVDSDITFPPDAVGMLLSVADPERVPVVGALYFGYTDEAGPFPLMYSHPALDGPFHVEHDHWQEGHLEQFFTGAGFLLVHRSVYEAHPAPFDRLHLGGVLAGEDLSFMHRLDRVGTPVHVHTGVRVGHVKQFIWDVDSYAKYRAETEAADG